MHKAKAIKLNYQHSENSAFGCNKLQFNKFDNNRAEYFIVEKHKALRTSYI